MSFLERFLDFFANVAPTRDVPGPFRDDPSREEWVVPPASGWTSSPLLMIRAPRYRAEFSNRTAPARARTAASFCSERRMLHRVDADV